MPRNGCVIEVDVYHGRVAGLIAAEVEFPNAESCASFQKPEWFGEDVSGVPRYSNYALALE